MLPLSGVLRPSETQQIQFTFYGHCGVAASAVAVCSVEGGPNYNITLSGEASSVSYSFDRTTIDCGKQVRRQYLRSVPGMVFSPQMYVLMYVCTYRALVFAYARLYVCGNLCTYITYVLYVCMYVYAEFYDDTYIQ